MFGNQTKSCRALSPQRSTSPFPNFLALSTFLLRNSRRSLASRSLGPIRSLRSTVAVVRVRQPRRMLPRGTVSQSVYIASTCSRPLLNTNLSILNYKGSWLEWTEREGKKPVA